MTDHLRFRERWSCFPNSFLDGFVEKGFGCGNVSFIVKSLSFIRMNAYASC
jgi:hypothetical protein